jgi:hypothetical protein
VIIIAFLVGWRVSARPRHVDKQLGKGVVSSKRARLPIS